jgi:hypothetical protein
MEELKDKTYGEVVQWIHIQKLALKILRGLRNGGKVSTAFLLMFENFLPTFLSRNK